MFSTQNGIRKRDMETEKLLKDLRRKNFTLQKKSTFLRERVDYLEAQNKAQGNESTPVDKTCAKSQSKMLSSELETARTKLSVYASRCRHAESELETQTQKRCEAESLLEQVQQYYFISSYFI